MKRSLLLCVLTLAATWLWKAPATADDVQLLPPNLMAPTSKDTIPAGKFKKDTLDDRLVLAGRRQHLDRAEHSGGQIRRQPRPNIKELRFVEANWQPAKQVADIEDLMAHKVDALIVAPISVISSRRRSTPPRRPAFPSSFSARAAPSGATVSVYGGGEAFGRTGGEFLKDRLHGKGTIWVFRGIAGVGEDTARYNGLARRSRAPTSRSAPRSTATGTTPRASNSARTSSPPASRSTASGSRAPT